MIKLKNSINIGLMGHVDSGKTSIAKALSSIGGTACFDKSPQSQSRGITLDLGFSTYGFGDRQVTIVDCPGHASLIRTVLCGAQIIDLIVLVVDATKGIQAQTAECLIIAEIMADRLIFAVNKIDLWPEAERATKFDIFAKKLRFALKGSKFCPSPLIPLSAHLGVGLDDLKQEIDRVVTLLPISRNFESEFVFAVDHCFPIKGQGTVLTGTVLQGQISVNESICIPNRKIEKKVKSIQSFREKLDVIRAGDRAGICVQSIDSEFIERTLICKSQANIKQVSHILLKARKIRYFKEEIRSKSKIHISILNEAVLCKEIVLIKPTEFGFEYVESISAADMIEDFHVFIEFEKPVSIIENAIVIGSKLDADPSLQRCRLIFHGRWNSESSVHTRPVIYRVKERFSHVDRIVSDNRLIGKGFSADLSNQNFKSGKDSTSKYIGMPITVLESQNDAIITTGAVESLFGSSGKFNVNLKSSLPTVEGPQNLVIKLKFGKILKRKNEKISLQ